MKIPEEILKLIKWEKFPKIESSGGQSVGFMPNGVTLMCDEAGFRISIDNYRSQIKNKELALSFFELYLSEIKLSK